MTFTWVWECSTVNGGRTIKSEAGRDKKCNVQLATGRIRALIDIQVHA